MPSNETPLALQQEMAGVLAAQRRLMAERIPYVMAVETASPDKKKLMLQALMDFDSRAEPVMREHIEQVKAILQKAGPEVQHLAQQVQELMQQAK